MKITFLAIITSTVLSVSGQKTEDLFMPREYKQAYNIETRSYNGKPGKNYFQNKTDYSIKAEFFPETKMLIGNEIITYKNNSHDTLPTLYINLYQNLYKKGEAVTQILIPKIYTMVLK